MSTITYTSKTSGKTITISTSPTVSRRWLKVTVDGKGMQDGYGLVPLDDAKLVKAREGMIKAGMTHAILCGGTKPLGVPQEIAERVEAMIVADEAADDARGPSRQSQYGTLVAKYEAAKHAAEQAREAAYRNDTGAGWTKVRKLDDAAEAARLAVVDFGGEHSNETAEARDD